MRKNILKWWSGLQQNQSRQAARDAWRASFNVTDETQWAVYMNGVRAGHVTEQMIRRIEHLLQDDKRLRYWHLGRVGEGLSTVLNVMSELVRFLAVGFATVSGLVVFAALCSSTEVARWLQLAAAQPADTARTLSTAATGISLVMMAATIAYLMGRINEASPDPDPYRDAWIDRVRIAAQIVTLGALSCELPVANGRLVRLPHGGVFLRRGNEVLHGMGDA